MSVREILTAGHPTLRRQATELTVEQLASHRVQRLIDDLIDTRRAAGGAGLAANQIGEAVRIAVIEVDEATRRRYPYKPAVALTVIVNPEIEPLGEERFEVNEGCLSVPGLRGVLERFAAVRVRYLDRHGRPHEEVRRGLIAGTFQHEVDHLDGILFLDRVPDTRTLMSWESFERFHRASFEQSARRIVERHGS